MRGFELLVLDHEPVQIGLDGFGPVDLGLELVARRLEFLVPPADLDLECLVRDIGFGAIGPAAEGRHDSCWRVRDEEGFIALLATDLLTDIDAPNAQIGLTGGTGHHDPL